MRDVTFPPPLARGDRILVVSLSSNTASRFGQRLRRGVRELERSGFEVRLGAHVSDSRQPGLETVATRLADLHHGFADPGVTAIVSAIGGWASHQLLDSVDLELVRANPKWFIGYSDTSSFHLLLSERAGLASVYGPAVLPQFGEFGGVRRYALDSLLQATRREAYEASWADTRVDERLRWETEDGVRRAEVRAPAPVVIREGVGRGEVLALNLETLMSHAGTRYWPRLSGRILLVEISDSALEWQALRLVHQLSQQEEFGHLRGLALGRIPRGIGIDAGTVLKRLREVTGPLAIPVVADLPFGHVDPIMSIALRRTAELTAEAGGRVSLRFDALGDPLADSPADRPADRPGDGTRDVPAARPEAAAQPERFARPMSGTPRPPAHGHGPAPAEPAEARCPAHGDVDGLLTTDPYRAYSVLWAAGEAATWHEPTRSWYVTDPVHVREMLTDRRFVARGASPLEPALVGAPGAEAVEELEAFLGCWPVFSDAPVQRTASQALRRSFSRARAEQLRPAFRTAFAGIVERADRHRPVATFARPVSEAMLSLLLGLTADEVDLLRSMTAATIGYLSNDGQDVAMARAALDRIGELEEWLAERGSRGGQDWLLTELDAAGVELSRRELAAVYMQVVTGALDPTSHALTGALRFVRHSPQARALAAAGDFAALVELCLGHDTGFHFAPRRSGCPIAFHGREIGAGERVVGVLAWAASVEAGNDGGTAPGTPRGSGTSLAFGHGRHFCLGAGIAQVAMEEALRAALALPAAAGFDVDAVERLPALGASLYRDPAAEVSPEA
ncbi:LD-carboxypeptidase [Kitasatospora sp. NPDC028055]|uniref:LD-carboxypeptidase n=1 Tax=Kitasatospora sp. NPDC028055 TaxID=3155653 RepID=UPI0033D84D8C